MTYSITMNVWHLGLIFFSVILFIAAGLLCKSQGLFDGPDTYGIGGFFIVGIFAIFWGMPSVLAWAIWATWIK